MLKLVRQVSPHLLRARASSCQHAINISKLSSSSSSDTDFKPSEELAKERYDVRASEDVEKKRARLLYQSRKRGMLENGVILASFANKYLHTFDANDLDQYDQLINLPTNDWDIFYWATRTKPTPPQFETAVMHKLREHIHSKVSNEVDLKAQKPESIFGKSRPDDIIMPAKKRVYPLEVDLDQVSMVDYDQELFDDRKKQIGRSSMPMMTTWRKKFFERRLRRKLPSPAALKNLSDDNMNEVFTQKPREKHLLDDKSLNPGHIDTIYEKNMKHHDLLQHMLSNNLTNDALEYDDEAEAWADMLWHRDYGCHNDKIAIAQDMKCYRCLSHMNCSDPGSDGYVPQELFYRFKFGSEKTDESNIICQRCKFSMTYNAKLGHDLSPEAYEKFLKSISRDKTIKNVVILCDLTDFPGSIWEGIIDLIGNKKRIIVVGNKLDLLPYDGTKFLPRVQYAMRKNLARLRPGNTNLYVNDVIAISARTGYGVEGLVTRLLSYCEDPQDIYLIGNSNTGKSTLFNALMQTDLCAIRKGDILSRVSKYECPKVGVSMLRFPIDWTEGWHIELRKRKLAILERNTKLREHSLHELSKRRQQTIPHMSMLVNRLDYRPTQKQSALIDATSIQEVANYDERPQFTEDHPLISLQDEEPLTATEQRFPRHSFFHHTPSASHPDQIHDLLTQEERLDVFHNETLMARKYSLRPLQSIFIAGLARLDLLTSQANVLLVIYASKYLPIHVVPTKNADKFYSTYLGTAYLGVPRGSSQRLAAWPQLISSPDVMHIRGVAQHMGAADVVFSSIGWASIDTAIDRECIVRAYTPDGRGIFLRDPPLLSRSNTWSMGKKLRDTPVFQHPHFPIERRNADDFLSS